MKLPEALSPLRERDFRLLFTGRTASLLGSAFAPVPPAFPVLDDLDGTVQEEKVYHMAGARTPEAMTPQQIETLITAAGRQPVERDTLYNVVVH